MREPLDSRDRWISAMTQAATPQERKPRSQVRIGDVAEFSPGRIVCFCGASSRSGYFHMSDSNGWPVNPADIAEDGRPGYLKDELLWDGARVVCSACSTIYDCGSGMVTGFGTPPPFTKKAGPKQRVSDEERRKHRREGLLTKARHLFRRRGPAQDNVSAEKDWQTRANAAVEAWKAKGTYDGFSRR